MLSPNSYVQPTIALLRFWTLTGKLPQRHEALVSTMRRQAERVLGILDRELSRHPFIAGDTYSIADISVFAYTNLAREAGIATEHLAGFQSWLASAQPARLSQRHLPLHHRSAFERRAAVNAISARSLISRAIKKARAPQAPTGCSRRFMSWELELRGIRRISVSEFRH